MIKAKTHAQLAKDLKEFTAKACKGIDVQVEHSQRWNRPCFTFRWSGFEGLLLEERFRLIARLIPPDYFEQHCQGAVWLELTPKETVESYLAQPRSEDIDDQLPAIWRMLNQMNFFAALEDELCRIPFSECPDDFSITRRVFAAMNTADERVRDALLAFMRHQAYTDWEVLRQVRPIAEAKKGKS
jgi:hypothetical protein